MKKVKYVVIVLLIAVAAVGFYWYFSQKPAVPNEIKTDVTELDKVLAKDLSKDYPSTPREVVKLYSQITKCFYNYELSADELDGLVDMSMAVFDDELVAANPKTEYVERLKSVIAEYNAADRVIIDYLIQESQLIEKYYSEGVEYAKVNVVYSIKDMKAEEEEEDKTAFLSGCGSTSSKTYQYYDTYEEFLLRRDSEGKWKILVWRELDLSDLEEE